MKQTEPLPDTGKGEQTRQQILASAADLASAEGLEGLTVGKLAKSLGMSKSGLYGHFRSKEALQLAVVALARRNFEVAVFPPADAAKDGLAKLSALLLSWVLSIERSDYRGGCFFAAASAEFDDRPGAVRNEIARLSKLWIDLLMQQIEIAKQSKHLKKNTDVTRIAFELHAFVQEANWAKQLLDDQLAFDRAKHSLRMCLERETTAYGLKIFLTTQLGAFK